MSPSEHRRKYFRQRLEARIAEGKIEPPKQLPQRCAPAHQVTQRRNHAAPSRSPPVRGTNGLDLVTACITTYIRPRSLQRLRESIDRHYPRLKVAVLDTGGNLSRARNELARMIDTPYYLMLEDDCEFIAHTAIEPLVEILDSDRELGGVGCALSEHGRLAWWCHDFDLFRGEVTACEAKQPMRFTRSGIPYRACQLIKNVGLFRREVIDYDERLAMGEHIEFFYRVAQAGRWRFAHTHECTIGHYGDRPTPEYNEQRKRATRLQRLATQIHGVHFRFHRPIRPAIQRERPNIIVMGVGHSNTTTTTKQLEALGWNLGSDVDPEYAECRPVREINMELIRGGKAGRCQARALSKLPGPWCVKDPRFCVTLHHWLPALAQYEPLLLWIRKDMEAVLASHDLRREKTAHLDEWYGSAERQYHRWPWAKIAIDAERVADACRLFDPARAPQPSTVG